MSFDVHQMGQLHNPLLPAWPRGSCLINEEPHPVKLYHVVTVQKLWPDQARTY